MKGKILGGLLIVILLILSGQAYFLYRIFISGGRSDTWSSQMQRDYASKLSAEGLKEHAVLEYKRYIKMAKLGPEQMAKILYTVGKLEEEINLYEDALADFYKAKMLTEDQDLSRDIGERIVACLEKMGRGLDAQRKLDEEVTVGKEKKGKVVARIGKEVITVADLNREIEKLPSWMQEEFKKKDRRKEFLRQYVAMELLYRKAKRLGYDKDPDFREKLEDIKKNMIVQQLLEDEINERVKITEDQVKLYYEANKDRYKEPAKLNLAIIKVSDKNKAERVMEEVKGGKSFDELVKQYSEDEKSKEKEGQIGWVSVDQKYIEGIGSAPEFIKQIAEKEVGETSGPFKVDDKYYIVKVIDKKPEHHYSFDEVKDRARYDYEKEVRDTVFKTILEETLKAEDVKLYEENL